MHPAGGDGTIFRAEYTVPDGDSGQYLYSIFQCPEELKVQRKAAVRKSLARVALYDRRWGLLFFLARTEEQCSSHLISNT